ncbi:cwf18 and/or RRM 1 domain containing protein [Asbolus verrucosus]|uniref:Cwf18 and/or RRM 1 domain containing protein n=1 Tax=Asbolus verrucosus TaxID=1661398 RepID=A0A482VDY3_ASBVE|nr:cwf18 and/or RRM 1 domain containing protein [Asbolus verrucosus]
MVIDQVDISTLAPRQPDWDLKRDVEKKLEKLARRTQKAMAELIREKLKEKQDLTELPSEPADGAVQGHAKPKVLSLKPVFLVFRKKMSRYREWDLSCKVYVGNLGSSASKHEIESAFSKYGPLRNVWVARNPPGFAFVEFEDPRDAEDAVRGLDGT